MTSTFKTVGSAAILCVGIAAAQDFAIDWFTIDGGGGSSAGGAYTVFGTIGQPDAAVLAGESFTLMGGFLE